MPRPLLLVIALDTIGIIGVLVAGFAHQQGDRTLMTVGITVTAACAVAGALTLVAWSRRKRQVADGDGSGPVVREL